MSWRNTKEYRNWLKDCKERDEQKCVLTGFTTNLEVHHIEHATYNKDLRFDVNNGVTIHRTIHRIFHLVFMRSYRKNCSRKDWEKFVYFYKYFEKLGKMIQ